MGIIINIEQALEQRSEYNILREPLNEMLKRQQEAWEVQNAIDLLYVRTSIATFQETFTSTIGFSNAFSQTGDLGVAPLFNTAEGFSTTFTTKVFMGGFMITQQVLEDQQTGMAIKTADAFQKAWLRQLVEYACDSIGAGFGNAIETGTSFGNAEGSATVILNSADTVSGAITDTSKNPLFTARHTIVRRRGMTDAEVQAAWQSNAFYAAGGIDLASDDPGKLAKLGDLINQVITIQENYRDDNNKAAVILGEKTIVCANDARLKHALKIVLENEDLRNERGHTGVNPAYGRATWKADPMLNNIPCLKGGIGFFIVDKAYNAANNGPSFVERIPFTLNVINQQEPQGIKYSGRQRFDVNVASWRGIVYVSLVDLTTIPPWANTTFSPITLSETIVKPVAITGTVTTTTVRSAEEELALKNAQAIAKESELAKAELAKAKAEIEAMKSKVKTPEIKK